MIIKSIRWYIQLWHAILLAVLLSVLLSWIYHQEKKTVHRALEWDLASHLTSLLPKVFARRDLVTTDPADLYDASGKRRGRIFNASVLEQYEKLGYYYVILRHDGSSRYVSPSVTESAESIYPRVKELMSQDERGDKVLWHEGNPEYVHKNPSGSYIIIGRGAESVSAELAVLKWRLGLLGGGVFVVGVIGGWFMSGLSIRPLKQISETAARITKGQTKERIDLGTTKSELGNLAATLNQSFDQLSELAQKQVRFVADASHDLRTRLRLLLLPVKGHCSAKKRCQKLWANVCTWLSTWET